MSESHSAAHEDLLKRSLVGELAPDAQAALFRECDTCRQQYERLIDLTGTLDEMGREEREVLREIGPVAKHDERVAQTLHALIRDRAGPARNPAPSRGRLILLAAVTAAILLLSFWLYGWLGADGRGAGDNYLGPGGIEEQQPAGEVREFGTFRWSLELPPGGWFQLTIRGASAPGVEVFPIERKRETEWTPDAQQRELLPDDIFWEVASFTATGNLVKSVETHAWLSPP